MHDWLGMGLVVLGLGLLVGAVIKRQNRLRTPIPAGAIRPEFAAMGEVMRPLILFAVGLVALKMSLFYFVFGGSRLMSALDYGGLMFMLAAYCAYLAAATSRPAQSTQRDRAPAGSPVGSAT